jgi:hypothetical protein
VTEGLLDGLKPNPSIVISYPPRAGVVTVVIVNPITDNQILSAYPFKV